MSASQKFSSEQTYYLHYFSVIALPEFSFDKLFGIGALYNIFGLENNEHYQWEAAKKLTDMFNSITIKQLIWLSENVDWSDPYSFHIRLNIDWKNVDISRKHFKHLSMEEYITVLKLGTFHYNGYFREKCIEAVAEYDGSLPFLMLRVNDWVEVIREKAFLLVKNRLKQCPPEEIILSLPCLGKVKNSQRRKTEYIVFLEKEIEHFLEKTIRQINIDKINQYEIFVRNSIYRYISRSAVLELDKMEQLVDSSKDSYGKRVLIQGILKNYECDENKLREYLHNKSVIVRRCALEKLYGKLHNAWQGIEELLLDKSKKIREDASYIIEKHTNFNILNFYLQKLEAGPAVIPILGAGEHGTIKESELLLPFLEADDARITKAALVSCGYLIGAENEGLYWKYLSDRRPGVARQAYLIVDKLDIHYGAAMLYEAYQKNREFDERKYLLNLLLKEPSWSRLPFLLLLFDSETENPMMQYRIYEKISNRNMYSKVSRQQAKEIRHAFEVMGDRIPEGLKKKIEWDLKHVICEK